MENRQKRVETGDRKAKDGKEGVGMERTVVFRCDDRPLHPEEDRSKKSEGMQRTLSLPSPSAPDKVLVVQK